MKTRLFSTVIVLLQIGCAHSEWRNSEESKKATVAIENQDVVNAVSDQRDPKVALKAVDKLLADKNIPLETKIDAQVWRAAILEWNGEPARRRGSPHEQLTRAQNLTNQGLRFETGNLRNRAGLIYYLRASNILDDLLVDPRAAQISGEVLYNAGINANLLGQYNTGRNGQSYFETCIRQQPYTDLARRCYSKLEASLAGTDRDRIRYLKEFVERKQGQFLDWGFID